MERPVATLDVPIRWTDLDLQGHVNNTLVAEYLQEARTGLAGSNGPRNTPSFGELRGPCHLRS